MFQLPFFKKPKEFPDTGEAVTAPVSKFSVFFKKRIFISGAVVLLAAILLCVFIPLTLQSAAETYSVAVVTAPIEKGAKITPDCVAARQITDAGLAHGAVADPTELTGKYAAVDLLPDSLILPAQVSDTELYPDKYSHLNPGWTILSVPISTFSSGVSGKLRPGDIVTVYAVANNQEIPQAEIPPALRYVEVVAVTADNAADIANAANGEALEKMPATVTLLVSDVQALQLVSAIQAGYLHLGLACRNDDVQAQALLAYQQQVIAEAANQQGMEPEPPAETSEEPNPTEDTPADEGGDFHE